MTYTREFLHACQSKIPEEITLEMAKHGWDCLGIYETVQEQRRQHRKLKLPVFQRELVALRARAERKEDGDAK